jgi:DNA-binding transcriptional regulator/RsmH inhibitor MraZ
VELDQGGRALLPQQLRSYAGIGTGEVIMVGDGATFQLWSKKNYEQLVDTRGREEQIFATYTESGISI